MPRRKKGSIILRTQVTTDQTNYVSDDIDISALVDIPKGEVLLIKRAWISFADDSTHNAPLGSTLSGPSEDSAITGMATALSHTSMQPMASPDAICKAYFVLANDATSDLILYEMINLMRPQEFENGMYIATDQIHCAVDVGVTLGGELDVSFVFECETVTLNREQALDLAVSLQQ